MVDFVGYGKWDVAETALILLFDGDEVLTIWTVVGGFFVGFDHFVRRLAVELLEVSEDPLPPFLNIFICGSGELIDRPFSLKDGPLFTSFFLFLCCLSKLLLLLYDLLEG